MYGHLLLIEVDMCFFFFFFKYQRDENHILTFSSDASKFPRLWLSQPFAVYLKVKVEFFFLAQLNVHTVLYKSEKTLLH